MLVEIHMLQSHGPSNPNRDDLGAPKTAMFGGVMRARISSQCIKRSIRTNKELKKELDGLLGERTVSFPDLVAEALKGSKIPEKDHGAVVSVCRTIAKGEEKKGDEDEGEEDGAEDAAARTAQLIFVGPTEAAEFVRILQDFSRDEEMQEDYKEFVAGKKDPTKAKKKDKFWARLKEAYKHNGVDISLFGRMTTSAAFENVEASMQVAHAISTHAIVPETDYYTTVDDRQPKEQTGAGFVGEAQFSSAIFYKYFSLDWDALVRNLGGNAELARKALRAFLDAAAVAVPSGKRNSYANNNPPDAILVEVRERHVPTSYVNSFLQAAGPYSDSAGNHDPLDDSIRKLRHYSLALQKMYGLKATRFWCATRPDPLFDKDQMKGEEIRRKETLSELRDSVLKTLEEVGRG